MDMLALISIAIFIVFSFELLAKRQNEIDYIVNPLNMRAVLKRCYYDEYQRKKDLREINGLIHELESKRMGIEKEPVIRFITVHGNIDYLTSLRQAIKENSYEKELYELSKQDRLLDNWDDF